MKFWKDKDFKEFWRELQFCVLEEGDHLLSRWLDEKIESYKKEKEKNDE